MPYAICTEDRREWLTYDLARAFFSPRKEPTVSLTPDASRCVRWNAEEDAVWVRDWVARRGSLRVPLIIVQVQLHAA